MFWMQLIVGRRFDGPLSLCAPPPSSSILVTYTVRARSQSRHPSDLSFPLVFQLLFHICLSCIFLVSLVTHSRDALYV